MNVKNNALTLVVAFILLGCIRKMHNEIYYTVQPEDTLSSISYEQYKNKICWRFIAIWNNIPLNKANNIKVGQSLKLINPGLTPILHKVLKGETLTNIAKNNSIDFYDLKAWNNSKTDKINEGQRLIVGWSNPLIAFFFNNKCAYFTIWALLIIIISFVVYFINKWLEKILHRAILVPVLIILVCFIIRPIAKFMRLGVISDLDSFVVAMIDRFSL